MRAIEDLVDERVCAGGALLEARACPTAGSRRRIARTDCHGEGEVGERSFRRCRCRRRGDGGGLTGTSNQVIRPDVYAIRKPEHKEHHRKDYEGSEFRQQEIDPNNPFPLFHLSAPGLLNRADTSAYLGLCQSVGSSLVGAEWEMDICTLEQKKNSNFASYPSIWSMVEWLTGIG